MIQSANPAVPKTVWLFKSTCAVVAFAGIMCSTNLASQQDDGFYVLSVARNIASGRGITIDGHAKSNGFQPLWALVTVPIFVAVAGDRELGVRAVLWLQWLLLCGTAYLLSTIIRTVFQTSDDPPPEVAFWATAFVYLTGVLVFAMHFNLLETGLLLFMYTLIARVYQLGALADRRRWLLYVLLGLLVLTRIDAAFFVVALSLMQLWKAPNGDGVKSCGLMLLVPFLVSSPWWLFNFLEFGSLMPSSGAAQTELTISVERIRSSLFAVTQVLTFSWL